MEDIIENDHILRCKLFSLFVISIWWLFFLLRENIDAKIYVGNVPTEKMTDEELLDFFKPFGKVLGMKIFLNSTDYLFKIFSRYTSV